MSRCFVIQPFDGGEFDKRYDDIISPAIRSAGLEPYRVDRDHSVTIPIEDIETGIRNSDFCLAEISLDNPNVWFELGFAMSCKKEVVLICEKDIRTSFPFDVRHRSIINYSKHSNSDFKKLENSITERLNSIKEKQARIGRSMELSPTKPLEGIEQHEISCLIAVAQNSYSPEDPVYLYHIFQDMEKFGYTEIAISLALRSLLRKKMLSLIKEVDTLSNSSPGYFVTESGSIWLEQNHDRLILNKNQDSPPYVPQITLTQSDDIDESDPFADD